MVRVGSEGSKKRDTSRSDCGSVAIINNPRLRLGHFSEEDFPPTPLMHRSVERAATPLNVHEVTLAAVALCHSDDEIHCGVSIVPADHAPETIAATDDLPVRVDWLQYELRQGPFMGGDLGETLVVKDLAAQRRWPDFGKMCVAVMNVRSMLSVKIPVPAPDRARLNFYSSGSGAFDHLDLDAALCLARSAAPMVRVQIDEFRDALSGAAAGDCSRVAIAVGTVIARYRVSPADAFDLLREASRDLHRALLGVAIDVVAAGHLPEEAMFQARVKMTGDLPRRGMEGTPNHEALGAFLIGGPELWRDPVRS